MPARRLIRLDDALTHLARALDLHQALGNRTELAHTHLDLARLHARRDACPKPWPVPRRPSTSTPPWAIGRDRPGPSFGRLVPLAARRPPPVPHVLRAGAGALHRTRRPRRAGGHLGQPRLRSPAPGRPPPGSNLLPQRRRAVPRPRGPLLRGRRTRPPQREPPGRRRDRRSTAGRPARRGQPRRTRRPGLGRHPRPAAPPRPAGRPLSGPTQHPRADSRPTGLRERTDPLTAGRGPDRVRRHAPAWPPRPGPPRGPGRGRLRPSAYVRQAACPHGGPPCGHVMDYRP